MSKFRIWVDDSNLDKVMGFDQFDTDTQRQAGFTGGMPASSIRVNTALRQANLVACALMNLADTGNTADFRSSVATVQSLLSNYISNTMVAYKATNADINNLNTENNAVVNFKIGNGTAYNKTINNVANVTTNINGNAISSIFESNGTTVKNATNSINSNNAENARKINNIEIKQDENGVLKYGDIIISQKKLLFNSSSGVTHTNSIPETLDKTSKLEIVYSPDGDPKHKTTATCVLPAGNDTEAEINVRYDYEKTGGTNSYEYIIWKIYVYSKSASARQMAGIEVVHSSSTYTSAKIYQIYQIID